MKGKIKIKCKSCGCKLLANAYDEGGRACCPKCGIQNRITAHKKPIFELSMPDATTILAVASITVTIFCGGYIAKCIYKDFSDGSSDNYFSGSSSDPTPKNIIAVKETTSNHTVGIIATPKGKTGYIFVPEKKSYEITYEENGILKTKTMSRDPTK